MLTLDLDPAALLKAAAQMTNEYGCEVVITKNGNLLIRPAAEKRTSTERVRRHREAKRLAETSVMKAVFEQCETSFNDETHETSEPVSSAFTPSPPPSPPSPRPPSSAPTPAPVPPPARESRRRSAKRQQTETNLLEAQAVPLPTELDTSHFRQAWTDWCEHRAALAHMNPQKQWTALAARNTLAECSRHGLALALQAIPNAIANGWQSLVWERLNGPRNNNGRQGSHDWNGQARPRYPAYQVATATLGQSPEDISTF